jgi:hypothetical protein
MIALPKVIQQNPKPNQTKHIMREMTQEQESGGLAAMNFASRTQAVNDFDQRVPIGEDPDEWHAARAQARLSGTHRAFGVVPPDALDKALASKDSWDNCEPTFGLKSPVNPQDHGMSFKMDGSESGRKNASEKVIACTVIRDVEGMRPTLVKITGDAGICCPDGRFMKFQSAVSLSLTGLAWDTLNGNPRTDELEETTRLIKDLGFAKWVPEMGFLTDHQSALWELGKTIEKLLPHADYIRREAQRLVKSGYLHPMHQWRPLSDEMRKVSGGYTDTLTGSHVMTYTAKHAA